MREKGRACVDTDRSDGGCGEGLDWRAHGVIRARRESDVEGGCGTFASRRAGPAEIRGCVGVSISSRILEMHRNIGTKLDTAIRVASCLCLDVVAENKLPVLDLGCGDGVFLEATAHVLRTRYPDHFPDAGALARVLRGVEIDPALARQAEARLTKEFGEPPTRWDIRVGDALSIDEDEAYEAIVGNPPWVRLHHLDAAVRTTARCNFRVATGAFDLAHLFVEKAVRLLGPGGQLAFVVPRGIQCQPAAAKVRDLLGERGSWTMEPLPEDSFSPRAGIDAGLLAFSKDGPPASPDSAESGRWVLGDVAWVTTGVATGADKIFVVDEEAVRQLKLETEALRPVIRGRDVGSARGRISNTTMRLIWPYRQERGRWTLRDLSDWPNVAAYLEEHREALARRKRLLGPIERCPSTWYRFIDPGRASSQDTRVVIPDIFRAQAFAVLDGPSAAVMNTCFVVIPKPGCRATLLRALESGNFWRTLRARCRRLRNGYHRGSVGELRLAPLDRACDIV